MVADARLNQGKTTEIQRGVARNPKAKPDHRDTEEGGLFNNRFSPGKVLSANPDERRLTRRREDAKGKTRRIRQKSLRINQRGVRGKDHPPCVT
jgi:hypothetical protein